MAHKVYITYTACMGLSSGKESTCQCRRCKRRGFNSWFGKILWRRKRQPTPVFLPGEFHGKRSLEGYSPWGCKELDMTERLSTATHTACMNYTESWQKVRECRIDDGFGFVVFVCPVRPRGYMTYQSLLKKPCCQKWNLGFQIHKKQWITNSYCLELKSEWLMALRLSVNHSESVWVQ